MLIWITNTYTHIELYIMSDMVCYVSSSLYSYVMIVLGIKIDDVIGRTTVPSKIRSVLFQFDF